MGKFGRMELYTTEIFAKCLLDVLEMGDMDWLMEECPAIGFVVSDRMLSHIVDTNKPFPKSIQSGVHQICKSFVGLDGCPRKRLRGNELIKQCWIALEEKGFI